METKLPTFVTFETEMKDLIELVWANNKDTIYADVIKYDKNAKKK